ncbi:hypothetical protein Sjap_000533 [Stephania japonica]|uniref:Uncharacterized protein n=1 Tax=Stephania japonica TaxID=461633 RepID=A0AAP0PQJ2_9MAGN
MVASGNESLHHREYGISEFSIPMEYVRDGWMHQRENTCKILCQSLIVAHFSSYIGPAPSPASGDRDNATSHDNPMAKRTEHQSRKGGGEKSWGGVYTNRERKREVIPSAHRPREEESGSDYDPGRR